MKRRRRYPGMVYNRVKEKSKYHLSFSRFFLIRAIRDFFLFSRDKFTEDVLKGFKGLFLILI